MISRLGHEGIRLRPSLDHSRLVSVGPVADNMLQATFEHRLTKFSVIFNRAQDRQHLVECLHGALKADLPRLNVAFHRRFAHELPNQVVPDHVGAYLVAYPMRFLAPQVLHLHDGFERS